MTRMQITAQPSHRPAGALLLALGLSASALVAGTAPAQAYELYKTGSCSPGQKWDKSRPIKVRLLADSVFDWQAKRVQPPTFQDLQRLQNDIAAVVALYNSVPGTGLRLEHAIDEPIGGDSNLGFPEDESFGEQTIVIGFTDEVAASSDTAEAFAKGDPEDGCTRTRAHVMFRKTFKDGAGKTQAFNWIFGPPDDTDVDGRSFWTADQPSVAGASSPLSFLGILTHEMGHALGLGHPNENYAVMAQDFKTWFRGPDHVLRTRLLPDDVAGLVALYGDGSDRTMLDISATNTWYKSGDLRAECDDEEGVIDALEDQLAEAERGLDVLPPHKKDFAQQNIARINVEISRAEDDLQACRDTGAAAQTNNCKVSSRGDDWVDRSKGARFCGVNAESGSAYPAVGRKVCPGQWLQLRYTLNNQSPARDVLAKAEVWLSPTATLDVRKPWALKSPDVREFAVDALDSRTIGQMFRLPAGAEDGKAYEVFVRVVPTDPSTGADLWAEDADKWNNAIMLRSGITIDSGTCE